MNPTYFARIENGIVIDVAVTSTEFMAANPERYLGTWIETFIGVAGKTYAGVGHAYDATKNDFTEPKFGPATAQQRQAPPQQAP